MSPPQTNPAQHASREMPLQVRAGDLLIDLGRQRVMRRHEVIPLPKLSFDLLLALVRAAPNLVPSDALMERVWPKVVVSPETLNQRVKLLRDALADDPRNPRYVEGLRGRGYRFVPAVEFQSPQPEAFSAQASDAVSAEVAVPDPSMTKAGRAASTSAIAPVAAVSRQEPALAAPPRRGARASLWIAAVVGVSILTMLTARVLRRVVVAHAPTSVEVVAMQPRSVAVLPFEDLSPASGDDYIAAGIADSVLHELASVPELVVIARSSSFGLGKPTPGALEAGRRLGARYVVEGSLQRSGRMLRVTARLIDTRTNGQIGSVMLDRSVDSVFELQDRIAEQVARELNVTLHGEASGYAVYGTEAYLAYLRGRALIGSRRITDVESAIRQFSRAIDLAPSFAEAIAESARAKLLLSQLRGDDAAKTRKLWREVDGMIERAIAISPRAGQPYIMRAQYRLETAHDIQGAEADYHRGLELAPNFGPGLRQFASFLYDRGQIDDSLTVLDRAIRVDPLGAENYYLKAEIIRNNLGGTEETIPLYLQAIAVAPSFYPAYARLAQVRAVEGKLAEAIRYAEKGVAIEPKVDWPRDRLVWDYVDIGDLPAAREVLRGYAPHSPAAGASAALICYRAGRLERAEQRIRAVVGQPGVDSNGLALILATDALIERAVVKHDAAGARRFLLSLPGSTLEDGTLAVVQGNFPQVVQLAMLEHLAGDRRLGDALAERILRFLDRGGTFGLAGADSWARASAAALLGRDQMALSSIEKLTNENRLGWWDRVEGNPALQALRGTRHFRSIEAADLIWLKGQRQALGQLRLKGDVPIRSAVTSTPDAC